MAPDENTDENEVSYYSTWKDRKQQILLYRIMTTARENA